MVEYASSGAMISPAVKSRSDHTEKKWNEQAFLRSSDRFIRADYYGPECGRQDSPQYHAAYKDIEQPPKWRIKGWSSVDDAIKAGRGTSVGRYQSSFAPDVPLQGEIKSNLSPLTTSYPNESRLQELLSLQSRYAKMSPGPGQYEGKVPPRRKQFRRQHEPQLDGPFFLNEGEVSTREKEIIRNFKANSDLGPGDYEGLLHKDAVMHNAPSPVIGTSNRDGRSHHSKSLSISRSILRGVDWHTPVMVLDFSAVPSGTTSPAPRSPLETGASAASLVGHAPVSTMRSSSAPATTQKDGTEDPAGSPRQSLPTSPSKLPHSTNFAAPIEPAVSAADLLPPPPSHISRQIRGMEAHGPGDWNWAALGHNYRSGWTVAHGGAYLQGERYPRDSIPLPEQHHTNQTTTSGNYRQHSTDMDSQNDAFGIFSIPEEGARTALSDKGAKGARSTTGQSDKHSVAASVARTEASAAVSQKTTPPTLASRLDAERHQAAKTAAKDAMSAVLRRSQWNSRGAPQSVA